MNLDPTIERELDASGVPWYVVPGKKHGKLFVGGRMVAVVPRSRKRSDPGASGARNLRADVRRAIRAALEAAQ